MLEYSAAVALAGVLLFKAATLDAPASLTERPWPRAQRRDATDALRDLLGDAELEADSASVPTSSSTTAAAAGAAPDRVTTPVTVAGRRVEFVHEPLTLDDAATRSAVSPRSASRRSVLASRRS